MRPDTPDRLTCNPPPEQSPLEQIEALWRTGALTHDGVAPLARAVHLPVAETRGLLSWYADLRADPAALRICRGTSCMLAGAAPLAAALQPRHTCHGVYCLGYCDRAPAVLTADERVLTACRPAEVETVLAAVRQTPADQKTPPPPDIRCVAREAIVTGRLIAGGCDDLPAARARGVYSALEVALDRDPAHVLEAVEQSGIRGRGGAGYPTGRKWRTAAQARSDLKYIVANGDEGDPGSFIDRELMERDPHSILEGMLLAGFAVGAQHGIVFIRSEYPHAVRAMQSAIDAARAAELLGPSVAGRPFAFDVRIVKGLGSYVCGEETAMLNAIEGRRGEVRPRPPYPAECGLHGRPTVVDNVETLVNVPWVVRNGPAAYRRLGTPHSPGTKALCLNHGFARPGIVEVEFGVTLERVIRELAGGPARGADFAAILLGGPMGSVVLPRDWDAPVCIDAMSRRGIRLGHGGLVALPRDADFAALLRHMLAFVAEESCGKCTPCRIGSQRARELVGDGRLTAGAAAGLEHVFQLMEQASLCGFGREAPGPLRELIAHFAGPGERVVRP